jgi:hypothetical protein
MATVGAVLDGLLRDEDEERSSLKWILEQVTSEGDEWTRVRDVPVEDVRNEFVRNAIVARFSYERAILVEALLQKARNGCSMHAYRAELRGAGIFPLETFFPTALDAAVAVCVALNTDFERLRAHPDADSQSTLLLAEFSRLVDDWALEATWHTRLDDAALLPDPVSGCDDGEFLLCADDAIHFVCRGEASAPCVTITPFNMLARRDVYFVLDVSPVPRGPWPLWLTESTAEMEPREFAPVRPAATFAFKTGIAARRARNYFRLMSATVSNVYTIEKPS